jgi:type III pantothenate kinase
VVDIGNTRLKAGFFTSKNHLETFYNFDKVGNLNTLADELKAENIIISSVNKEWFAEEISLLKHPYYTFNHQSRLPYKIAYEQNEHSKAGLDRLAAIAGAISIFPNKNTLVIDCGTCITCSFITVENTFLGGTISPGINMRFRALHNFTSELPLFHFNKDSDYTLTGNNTESSIKNGVVNGIKYEIEGIIEAYAKNYIDSETIICGGDAAFFGNKISIKTRIEPHLVLYGLNNILTYNS